MKLWVRRDYCSLYTSPLIDKWFANIFSHSTATMFYSSLASPSISAWIHFFFFPLIPSSSPLVILLHTLARLLCSLQTAAHEHLKMHSGSFYLHVWHPSKTLHSLGIKLKPLTVSLKCLHYRTPADLTGAIVYHSSPCLPRCSLQQSLSSNTMNVFSSQGLSISYFLCLECASPCSMHCFPFYHIES